MTELELINSFIENNLRAIEELQKPSPNKPFDPFNPNSLDRSYYLKMFKSSLKNLEKQKRSLLQQQAKQPKTKQLKESPPGSGNYISD
ncbi:hypothetical protein [Scytonema sp. PCC 10023]|uniref:hypothetical protein n=1 Tax=Scytonema sp. PCC 10023 TaxID=1680591 RepID=UPI0039C6413C